ncbi:YopX family protein [Lacticaseibacillus paracasei]|uniref:YopX family protein n=1 Tax=Lacticaseibacillus paracasei TaxID=1597 RepID=UPI000F0B4A97|nr:YopX family protein [Lacticaseibacillus paracasei]MCB5816439.1 YopX family protein [Lacticaseibacillus paracasei]RND90993.1 YopX protein [Lacticaseibacillus paracasei]RNE15239.1 YopX protein [Lacticaseibacillus paracasei]
MKREIKFRAYSSHNHKMYPVSNIEWDLDGRIWVIADDGKNGIELIDEEANLMQYTGLHDKNGREVYEGDLFEHKFGYTVFDEPPHAEMGTECGVVAFDNGQFVVSTPGWGGRNLYELLLLNGHLNDMPDSDLFTMKVVGNKFENPELMEVTEHDD